MKINGKITPQQLKKKTGKGKIETVIVAFIDHYGRLIGKRVEANFFLENTIKNGTHACNYLLTTDMEMNPVSGFESANWQKGYGDFHLVPDFSTLRIAAWLKKTAIVFCDLQKEESHELIAIAPRSILKKQIAAIQQFGYTCQTASELEYYLFENSYQQAHQHYYYDLKPVGWYLEDYHILQGTRTEFFHAKARKYLQKSGVPIENSKGEWGLGQHELNIRYAEVLEMSDRHLIFKQCLKELADSLGISVTFMAKYHEEQAGSSCHLHLSLWKGDSNIFAGKQDFHGIKCSNVFRWFLGGWMKYIPETMPFYAPTVNSYKRYVDASWAPTRLAWSYDNRTAGFRVVGSGESLRIECRIPGADCNPYLAFAAALASGLEGIRHKIEPPAMFSGDVYTAKDLPSIATSLGAATQQLANSKFAKKVFGKEVINHYTHHFWNEEKNYQNAVTDWERKRYFERI